MLRFRAYRTIFKGLRHVLSHLLSKHVKTEPKHRARPRCSFEKKGALSSTSMLVWANLLCADSLFPKLLFVRQSICLFEHLGIFTSESFWKVILHMLVRALQNSASIRGLKLRFMKCCVVMNKYFTSLLTDNHQLLLMCRFGWIHMSLQLYK